ncbi:Mog1p PsbP-like protein, partial [Linderina pennispora]
MTTVRELYGGAMTMQVPSGMVDISEFRQVPDNQEVFCDTSTDRSLIIEILEAVPQPGMQAIEYHFAQLANANDAAESEIVETTETNGMFALAGRQQAGKFNQQGTQCVAVLLALQRIPENDADVLITMNVP